MLYNVCHVMLYNMCHVMLYNMCHVMLYNIKYVMLYNICNRLNFDRICIFYRHLRSSCGAERKFVKKIYRSEFLQSSFIFVIYLLKEVYRKIMSEIHFVGKTRYEDLTETGS